MTSIPTSSAPKKTTTHGGDGACSVCGWDGRKRPGCAHWAGHLMRAAWRNFREFDQAFSDSWWGDALGTICLVALFIFLFIFLPLLAGPSF